MRNLVDNKVLTDLSNKKINQALFTLFQTQNIEHIELGWSSFLQYIDCGDLLKGFPKFDQENNICEKLSLKIAENPTETAINELYDQLFIEFLNEVKKLPEVDPEFLLIMLQTTKEQMTDIEHSLLDKSLDVFEVYLSNQAKLAKHDLTLFLAWDRVCSNLAILFHKAPFNRDVNKGLSLLKNALCESFHHIYYDGMTSPSFLKMIEALYLYLMREEITQDNPDFHNLSFNQGSFYLTPYDELTSAFYVDTYNFRLQNPLEPIKIFTKDSPEQTKKRLDLAQYWIDILSKDRKWHYRAKPIEIKYL